MDTTDAPDEQAVATTSPAAVLPAAATEEIGCGDSGLLDVTLYGALAGELAWRADDMICQGMPRPDGAGARLRFAGKAGEEALPVAFIIAIPTLDRGVAATELPSVVTVIEEGRGRFFSTPDLDSCWTDITEQTARDDALEQFNVAGRLYCISPIPEVKGTASVSIHEMTFSGVLDWGPE